LSLRQVLSDLKAQRVRIDRAIATLERIRDSRGMSVPPRKADRRRRRQAAGRGAHSGRKNLAKPGRIIPFAAQESARQAGAKDT
jgi:hypothetical protein